jgi:hypothetical protein
LSLLTGLGGQRESACHSNAILVCGGHDERFKNGKKILFVLPVAFYEQHAIELSHLSHGQSEIEIHHPYAKHCHALRPACLSLKPDPWKLDVSK